MDIWAVSDGRPAAEDQVLGLAEAIARQTPANITLKRIRWAEPGFGRRPTLLQRAPERRLAADADPVAPPWPDLWIAAGRATLPFSLRLRRWSSRSTFVVQVQDPRWPSSAFDAVTPTRHDRVRGDNVIETTGVLTRVTQAGLAEAAALRPELAALPQPRVAVMIGGEGRRFAISAERAARLAAEIALAVETEGGSVLMAFAPTTPEPARDMLTARLGHLPGVICDSSEPDSSTAFLAFADCVLVTSDWTAMASQAAVTGAPVFVLPIDGADPRRARFHAELEQLGIARPFGGQLYRWSYEPLNESDRVARRILRRMRDVAALRSSNSGLARAAAGG